MAISPIQLLKQATSVQRSTLLAAALAWMLDAFDAMLYALVLTYVMRDLGMSKATSGLLYTLTLLASGIGGVCFGFLADRVGRKRALMLSISHLLDLLVRFRPLDYRAYAGGVSFHPRTRHGR